MTPPNFSDHMEVTITSPDSESNFGETSNDEGTPERETSNDEGTPEREISNSQIEMLDHTREGSNE